MKQKFRDAYMKVAETFAELSSARRLHVGAIVVKDDRIISIGYNGMPSGWDNNCEDKEYMDQTAGGWLSPEEIKEQWPWSEQQLPKTEGLPWLRYRLKTKLMQSLSWQDRMNLALGLISLLLMHLVWTVPSLFTNLVSIAFIIAIVIVSKMAYISWKKQE